MAGRLWKDWREIAGEAVGVRDDEPSVSIPDSPRSSPFQSFYMLSFSVFACPWSRWASGVPATESIQSRSTQFRKGAESQCYISKFVQAIERYKASCLLWMAMI